MADLIRIAKRSDVPRNRRLLVSIEGLDILLLNVDDRIYAIDNVCPHQHFSALHQGLLKELELTCPIHGSTFNVGSGESVEDRGTLRRYSVILDGDEIYVERPKSKL